MAAYGYSSQDYVVIAQSGTDSVISLATGTELHRLVIVPGAAACGDVTLKDGSGTGEVTVAVFKGQTYAEIPRPTVIDLNGVAAKNATATVAGWHISTGTAVSVVAIGKFA